MFASEIYSARRAELRRRVGKGIILLPGNVESPFNYPNNTYHFRQDSTFLYFFGHNVPSLVGVIDVESGVDTLYGDDFTVDDIIWMGPQPTVAEKGARVGISHTEPFAALGEYLKKAQQQGRKIHFLPPYRNYNKILLHSLLGLPVASLKEAASLELIKAVVDLRIIKEQCELEEIHKACDIGYEMHYTAMKIAKLGMVEQEIAGVMEGIAHSKGAMTSFPTILSQNGETLHNHSHHQILTDGRLIVIDAGAENNMNYCSDFTRTIPSSGKFTQQQKDIYNIVAAANNKAQAIARPGLTYKEVHLEACRVLAAGLKEVGLMKGDVDEAVAAGAHALFMPHGLGHMMGLDVHDMENLGEVYVGYEEGRTKSPLFGWKSLRLAKALEPGFVFTVEPGIYFIPDLIDKWRAEKQFTDFICYDKLDAWRNFGGIRNEEDYLVFEGGSRRLGKYKPMSPEEIEAEHNA